MSSRISAGKRKNRRNFGKYQDQFIAITAVVNPNFKAMGKYEINATICRALVRALKQHTPVDTGLLKASWAINKITTRSFEIRNNTPYGPFVDGGTAKIRPRRFVAKALRNINTYCRRYFGADPTEIFAWRVIEYRKDSYAGNPGIQGVLQ